MFLAKITIKHEPSSTVMGVAAYHGLVCAVYSVRESCAGRYVDIHTDRCSVFLQLLLHFKLLGYTFRSYTQIVNRLRIKTAGLCRR
jgi:hypothetical protein